MTILLRIKIINFDQQAMWIVVTVQIVGNLDCYSFAHLPKHMQFAKMNKKFTSGVSKKLNVWRFELIIFRKQSH